MCLLASSDTRYANEPAIVPLESRLATDEQSHSKVSLFLALEEVLKEWYSGSSHLSRPSRFTVRKS